MDILRSRWRCVVHPVHGFRLLAEEPAPILQSLGRFLAWRIPIGLLAWGLFVVKFKAIHSELIDPQSWVWRQVGSFLQGSMPDLDPREAQELLAQLPPVPTTAAMLAWGLLLVPIGLLSVWLHDAAWDHGCLWLAGGLKRGRGFRTTLVAESEALTVGAFGALAGLLGDVPLLGLVLGLPLVVVGIYFWVLRGFSLAAFHGTDPWRGVIATLLHLVLAGCCLCGLLGIMALMLFAASG